MGIDKSFVLVKRQLADQGCPIDSFMCVYTCVFSLIHLQMNTFMKHLFPLSFTWTTNSCSFIIECYSVVEPYL